MDATTTALIVSQTITFLLLIISEILPFTSHPYNGILQVVSGMLKGVATVVPPVETAKEPTVVVATNS
jgi:hypothetical protein